MFTRLYLVLMMIMFTVTLAQDCEFEVNNCSGESSSLIGELSYGKL